MSEKLEHDPTNERLVIRAAMAATPEQLAWMVAKVKLEHFFEARHRAIWQALVQLQQRGESYTTGSVVEGVEPGYLAEVEALTPPLALMIEWHVGTVAWDATRARMLNLYQISHDTNVQKERREEAKAELAKYANGHIQIKARNYQPELQARIQARKALGYVERGEPVLYLVEKREPVLNLLASMKMQVELTFIEEGHLTPDEQARVTQTLGYLDSRVAFAQPGSIAPEAALAQGYGAVIYQDENGAWALLERSPRLQ